MLKSILGLVSVLALTFVSAAADLGEILWEFSTGNSVVSSPILDSAGNAYVGSLDGYIYSVDTEGNQRWRFQTADWVESSPALSHDESRIYVGTWDDRILAINTSDGSLAWEFAVASLVYASPAVAADGTVYVGASDGYLYAINPNGSLKWDVEVGGELDSSPAIDEKGNVYVGSSSGAVVSVNAAGEERWSWDVPSESGAGARETDVSSSPMITSTDLLFVGSKNFYVYALDTTDGSLVWKYETGGIIEGSLVEGMGRSCLVAGRDGYLYSFTWDGVLNWRTFIGSNYYSTPCVDGMGRIYAGALSSASNGVLTVLSSEGEILRKTPFSSFIDSSPVLSPGGKLLVGSNDGKLYALEGGDRLASLGWSAFRGDAAGRATLQGYTDLTAIQSEIVVGGYDFDETKSVVANYRIEGGGPIRVQIRGLGSSFGPSDSAIGYDLTLRGLLGEMASSAAGLEMGGSVDGSIKAWLEPGEYVIEMSNNTGDYEAVFLEVRPL